MADWRRPMLTLIQISGWRRMAVENPVKKLRTVNGGYELVHADGSAWFVPTYNFERVADLVPCPKA